MPAKTVTRTTMPKYTQHHIHHETVDVPAALEWYKNLFDARIEGPVDKDGVPWAFAHIGGIQVTITARGAIGIDLTRYLGYDHFCFATDDFDATMARISELSVGIFFGPQGQKGSRMVFVNGPDNIKIEIIEKK